MDNPDDAKTIINVKGIVVRSYERAKKAANAANETMGSWLSRAMDQLANLEAGERYILPASPANHAPVPPPQAVDLSDLAAVLTALTQAGLPVQKRIGRHINAILNDRLAASRGLPTEGKLPVERQLNLGRVAGGHARAQSLSPERRKEIATQAANQRWGHGGEGSALPFFSEG